MNGLEAEVAGTHYRVRSRKVYCGEWYSTKMEAIEAFERQCQRKNIAPPFHYPPSVSGDYVTNIAYPRYTCAAGMREGHGWVYVEARNDVPAF